MRLYRLCSTFVWFLCKAVTVVLCELRYDWVSSSKCYITTGSSQHIYCNSIEIEVPRNELWMQYVNTSSRIQISVTNMVMMVKWNDKDINKMWLRFHQCVYIYSKCMMQESFTFNDGASSQFTGVVKLGLSAKGLFAVHIIVWTL